MNQKPYIKYSDKIPTGEKLYNHPVFLKSWKELDYYFLKWFAVVGATLGTTMSSFTLYTNPATFDVIGAAMSLMVVVALSRYPAVMQKVIWHGSAIYDAAVCAFTIERKEVAIPCLAFFFGGRAVVCAFVYDSYKRYVLACIISSVVIYLIQPEACIFAVSKVFGFEDKILSIFMVVMIVFCIVTPYIGLMCREQWCRNAVVSHIICRLSNQEYEHLHTVFSYTAHEYRNQFLLARLSLYQLAYAAKHTPTVPVDKFEEEVKVIEFAHENIGRLFNDVLTIHKMDQSQSKPQTGESYNSFNLWKSLICPLIIYGKNVVKLDPKSGKIRRQVEETKFLVEGECEKAKSCVILGDELKLLQAFTNLISNAFKFTTGGFVKLKYSVQNLRNNQYEVTIAIQDAGRGIPEDKLKEIFVAFRQCRPGDAIERGGTGLGLTIAKRIVEFIHNGKLTVTSEIGVGSEFKACIRFSQGEISVQDNIVRNSKQVWGRVKNVLVVDDCKLNTLMVSNCVKKIFSKFGVPSPKTWTAQNGLLAIERIKACFADGIKIDLIVIDRHMPVMDGVQAVQIIRKMKQELFSGVIIGFSGDVAFDHGEAFDNANLDGRIVKGCSVDEIQEVLEHALSQKAALDDLLAVDAEHYAQESQPQTETSSSDSTSNTLSNVVRRNKYRITSDH